MGNSAKRFLKLFYKNVKEIRAPAPYEVNNLRVICVHCRYDRFDHSFAQLNTALLSFFNLDFANRSANILTCDRCGYVHWFNKDIRKVKM